MITGLMFPVTESNEIENPKENWRTRSRTRLIWSKTYIMEYLISNYPHVPQTNDDLEMLEANIPEASLGQIKEFFANYQRTGPNERFKTLKRQVKEEADRRSSA